MVKYAYLLNRLTLVILLILVSGCTTEGRIIENAGQKIIPVVHDQGSVEAVYFCPRDDCEAMLSGFILSGKERVYCAFFDLDLKKVKSALNAQYKKGLDVKLVVDTDNYEYVEEFDFAKGDERSALMHNKFCIIDGKRISSGSMNPTINGAEKNNNNLIMINSKVLAKNYEDEFNEFWNGTFGKGDKVNNPVIYLNGSKIESYFCPEDKCSERVKDALGKAENSIYFLVFSFTHDKIANKIVLKMHENISVKGVFEKRGTGSEYSRYKLLEYQEADIRKDNNSAVLHHKVFIIDNKTVITGSFNPSKNADWRNDENILIIHDKETAERYLEELEYIWERYSS
jgi:phosphatidylserine/phosphatidylglycerophosphate/cardiolipin synthase-like enzyme